MPGSTSSSRAAQAVNSYGVTAMIVGGTSLGTFNKWMVPMPDMHSPPQLAAQRHVFRADDDSFVPYAPYGGVAIDGLSWINIDFDEQNRVGTYLLKFAPGAGSVMHEHGETEQFLIMDGELIDCDGHVMKPGDFLRYDKGSQHSSRTVNGCTILVILKGANKKLGAGGAPC